MDIINFLADFYKPVSSVTTIIIELLAIFYIHKQAYILIGLFFTRKYKHTNNYHKYAILIPARNEEIVIGNLIDSINKQDYPKEYLTIFVVADNCTDNTAGIAREKGAIVYEHNNPDERTKGYGLRYLFNEIERDYGIKSFEGYFIFDADNLLKKDYISRMNDTFDSGVKIVTSYRNTKNFDENWVASSYALHWLHSIRFRHRARSVLRLATNIQGTGFLFANELVENGWPYVSLTEDRAFTADAVAKGYQISYNDEAMFYDEQPTSIRISIRQRIRWSKGHLQAFVQTGPLLVYKIIVGNIPMQIKLWKKEKELRKTNPDLIGVDMDDEGVSTAKTCLESDIAGVSYKKIPWYSVIIEEIRVRWAAFDTLAQLFPQVIIKAFIWLFVTLFLYGCYRGANGIDGAYLFGGKNRVAEFVRYISGGDKVTMAPGVRAMWASFVLTTISRIIMRISLDFETAVAGAYLFIVERKRIKKIPLLKKILYCFTWTTFDIMYRYSMYMALFMKVEWKVIPHTSNIKIEDISD